jgi:pyrimidine-nucleoside phosphorylase
MAPYNPVAIIEKKKRGESLSADEIRWMIERYHAGQVPEYQMSALLMAIWFRGMDGGETADLTAAMLASGEKLDLSGFAAPKVDKHSTGGVGDKVSIALAPLAASLGILVPMLSGRSLGHTGGTLDKLEAIPGFTSRLSGTEMLDLLASVGCFISGQTDEIAPADKKLYALRDVTGTVDCVPLITSSILSKKLSEGIDALVMDVKYGSGAFMRSLSSARALAGALAETGALMGLDVRVLLTAMDEPLGCAVGNALEVIEAVRVLQGSGPGDLAAVTAALAAEMAVAAQLAGSRREARSLVAAALSSGTAMERFKSWVAAQGGRLDYRRADLGMELAPARAGVEAGGDGYICSMDARAAGEIVIGLGGGRTVIEDRIDPGVGLRFARKVGDRVRAGESLVAVHARDDASAAQAAERLRAAIAIGPAPPARRPRLVRSYGG